MTNNVTPIQSPTTSPSADVNSAPAVPMTGTWFARVGQSPYELSSGLDYTAALEVATHWATEGLTEPTVEVEVAVYPAGEEWVVDVVATELVYPFETLGTRRARIDSRGRLVA